MYVEGTLYPWISILEKDEDFDNYTFTMGGKLCLLIEVRSLPILRSGCKRPPLLHLMINVCSKFMILFRLPYFGNAPIPGLYLTHIVVIYQLEMFSTLSRMSLLMHANQTSLAKIQSAVMCKHQP